MNPTASRSFLLPPFNSPAVRAVSPWILVFLIANLGAPAPAQTARPSTRADVAALVTDLSNWGRWGAEDQLGALNLDKCDLELVSETAARLNRWDFLLTAAPMPVEGGTGSPLNPIATF